MNNVVGLSGILRLSPAASPGFVARGQRSAGFTLRDRADLDAWAVRSRRVEIYSSDTGVFAMLHERGLSWASWGVIRQSRTIQLWDCVTHADVGRFPTMMDALAAIASDGQQISIENVVSLRARRRIERGGEPFRPA